MTPAGSTTYPRVFAAALRDGAQPAPAGLRTANGSDPGLRFAIHRNNVVVALVEALAGTFDALRAVIGAAAFADMARDYVAAHPPRSPLLLEHGEGLADWLEACALPPSWQHLPDLARLEQARLRAYHAADAEPVSRQLLGQRLGDPAALPGSRLHLHPSVRLVRSRHAVVSLWAAHQAGTELGAVELDAPEAVLVLREDDDAVVVPLRPGTAAFIALVLEGRDCAAASAGAAASPDFDLADAFAVLVGRGAIVGWSLQGGPACPA